MAIRANPTLMLDIIEKMDYMVRVMDADQKVIYMNRKMREEFGHSTGDVCYKLLGRDKKCAHCVTQESQETGMLEMKDVPINGKYYKIMSSPVSADDGSKYSIEMIQDITEQKMIEDQLMRNYAKLKADIEFAKEIQKRVLPIDGTYWDTIEFNSIYQPSEDLGGDLFDVIKLDNERTLIYIADVSGHGVKSSLLTIFLRQMVRGRTMIGGRAFESKPTLKRIVDVLLRSYAELAVGDEQYLSVLFCGYNKERKELTFLNAGHNCLPIIIGKDGEVREVMVQGMPICKLTEKPDHDQVVVEVESGDRVLLYTDGITEAYNKCGVPYGFEGIVRTIKKNINLDGKALAKSILDEVALHTDATQIDDIAILVAKIL